MLTVAWALLFHVAVPRALAAPDTLGIDDATAPLDGDDPLLFDHLELPRLRVLPSPVVNGQPSADRANVVALAGIDSGGGASVFCSGTVVQDTWVLTAAHCITGASQYQGFGLQLHVIWGNDIVRDGYTYAIPWADGIIHPGYDGGVSANDIGLVELAESVPDWAPYTVLNDTPLDDSWIGAELTFVGFGITKDGGNDGGVMRETVIPIQGFDEQFVYAMAPGTNVCNGDSGGPSFRLVDGAEEQVGINSFVSPGCVGGSNGSANVVEFLPWVQGYVPNVLLEPGPRRPEGSGFDVGVDDPLSSPGIGMRFGPHKGTGPGEVGCRTAPAGLGVAGWLCLAAGLGVGRRRR